MKYVVESFSVLYPALVGSSASSGDGPFELNEWGGPETISDFSSGFTF